MIIVNLSINRWAEVYFCSEPKESTAKQGTILTVSSDLDQGQVT